MPKNHVSKTSGQRTPYWLQSGEMPDFRPLGSDTTADVLVIGGGITGLTTAYFAAQAGKQVALLDDGGLASGETGRTTAHLTCMLDFGYAEIERLHGEVNARLALESQEFAIDAIENIVRDEAIDCDFKRLNAYLFLAEGDKKKTLSEEVETLHRLGFWPAVLLDRAPLPFDSGPCALFPEQARFHVAKYLRGVAEAAVRLGARIYTNTAVKKIEGNKAITAGEKEIQASQIVIATHAPIEGTMIFTKQSPYRSYVVTARVPRASVTDGLYWDTGDPYHYVRLQELNPNEDLLILGGEDHKTGQPGKNASPFEALRQWGNARFPMIRQWQHEWSGQVIEPVDALAFIGAIPYRHAEMYMATGFSGNGMTYGTLAARLITDLLGGKKNAWTDLYNPTRKNLKGLKDFAVENLNVLKHFAGDRLKKESAEAETVGPGEGAVVRDGAHKVAVYRDESGKLHGCSAVCTHLGCIVQWNGAEKSFDCPCHGSRFSPYGEVLSGPATQNLKPVEIKIKREAA